MDRHQDFYEMLKKAEATETNENQSVSGELTVHEPPDDYTTAEEDEDAVGDDVKDTADDTEVGVLERTMNQMKATQRNEAALVGSLLSHGSSGQFQTSNAALKDKAKLSHQRQPTLQEKVRKLIGFR